MSGVLNLLLAGAASAIKDAYYNLTTLLLNTSSTNGAQNNTFLDSSTNNFTITRNGNTTQGTFTPFSQTGWSNYFSGAYNYLSIADNAVFDFGTGNFCVEFWFNAPNQTTSYPAIISSSGYTGALSIRYDNTGYDNKIFVYMGGGGDPVLASTNAIANNVWAHVAVVRDSTTSLKIYVNGVLDGTATISSSLATDLSNGPMYVGRGFDVDGTNAYFTGYVSNIRVTKGGAVYTSAFTPSTTPLTTTVPSGTVSLLTCQSNRFLDNSTNAFAITANGTPSVQAFSPFAPTAAYDTAVVGGSGYFDGSGDYLSTSTGTSLGSGDFTISCWVYLTASVSTETNIGQSKNYYTAGFNGNFVFRIGTSNLWRSFDGQSSQATIDGSFSFPTNTWFHMAWVRSGTTVTVYRNGVSLGSTTDSKTLSDAANGLYVAYSSFVGGYIADFRVVVGTAITSMPTAPATAVSGTSLLLNFTNAGIYDSTAKNVLETVGNAQVSTTVSKWGTTSMYFDGTGDYLQVQSSVAPANFNMGTGNYTVEFWMYSGTPGSQQCLFDFRNADVSGQGIAINYRTDRTIAVYMQADRITSSAISANTWTHIAVVRSSGTYTLYINGVSAGTWANSDVVAPPANRPIIGAVNNGTQEYNGYLDDLRITKGYARYTANFTPPTAAFPLQ